jgi:hypothetical protein
MKDVLPAPDVINSFAGFLKYGPTGIAGLMLLLTIVALISRAMDRPRERLLTKFMYVGAFCFALSLAAQFFSVAGAFPLHVSVYPLDLGETRKLPKPIITANNKRLDDSREYLVKSEVMATVDVSDAINYVSNIRNQLEGQSNALRSVVSQIDPLVTSLQRVTPLVTQSCSGGAHGEDPAHASEIRSITSSAATQLSAFRASLSSAVANPP